MSVAMGAAQLNDARKALLSRWDELSLKWKDDVANKFGEQFVAQLDRDFRDAAQAMAEMDNRMRQIRRECE